MVYFADNEIKIYRYRQLSNNRLSFSATFTVYDADIQPANPERIQTESGQITHLFTAFVDPDAQVKEGDELRVIGSDHIYTVKGVNRWLGAGILDHIELTLARKDDNG